MSADWNAPVLVALQPSYLPWLGAFEQFARSDVFVFYDDVQYDRDGWRNRNRIKTAQGVRWLTVPVQTSGRFGQLLKDVKIDNRQAWAQKHLRTLEQAYAKMPGLEPILMVIRKVLEQHWEYLADLNIAMFLQLGEYMGLTKKVLRSSKLYLPTDKNQRLVELCCQFSAKCYYSGNAARNYLKEDEFNARGITVRWQIYDHPVYPQKHGDFISHLSVVDYLINCGPFLNQQALFYKK